MPFDENNNNHDGGGNNDDHDFDALYSIAMAGINSVELSSEMNGACTACAMKTLVAMIIADFIKIRELFNEEEYTTEQVQKGIESLTDELKTLAVLVRKYEKSKKV